MINMVDGAEVTPLSRNMDRISIHSRLVGPLANAVLINAIDEFRERESNQLLGLKEEIDYEFAILRETASDDKYRRTEGIWQVIGRTKPATNGLINSARTLPLRPTVDVSAMPYQRDLMRSVTALESVFNYTIEGYEAQTNATFNLALPGYIAASYDLSKPEEITRVIKMIGPDGVSEILRKKDFIQSLSRLALTANGMYRKANYYYVDESDHLPALDAGAAISRCPVNDTASSPEPVTIFGLYERDSNDTCKLSEEARTNLKHYLRYRNYVLLPDQWISDTPGPSRGCPVVQASVRINETDYTDSQWKLFTGGEKPICRYDPNSSRLVFLRQAIPEVSKFFADILDGSLS